MPASKPVRPTQPHLYNPQVENPQSNRQESPMDRSSNQPTTVYRQTDLVHSSQYWYAPLAGQRAVQTGPINTGNGKRLEGPIDCDGCVARGVSCTWTSKVTCTSIFREVFVGGDSAKVKPEYSRLLETIHEGDEGGD
ncbi:hypothetical protein ACHAP3_006170 [Botrytis cinerea]